MVNPVNLDSYAFLKISSWLVEHGFQLNNREWASLVWIGILAACVLPRTEVRQSLIPVIRSVLSPKLLIIWISLILWVVLIVFVAKHHKIWDSQLTKDTIVWTITVGLVSLTGFTKAHEQGFFRLAVVKTAGVTVFIEYLTSLSPFPIFIEILLQPLVLIFATAPILVKTPKEQLRWQGWSERFFILLALVFLGKTALSLMLDWNLIDWHLFVLRALWPISLGLWVLLLVFVWSVVSSYEQLFLRLEFAQPDSPGLWKNKAGTVMGLGFNLEAIHCVSGGSVYHIARAQSLRAAWLATRKLRSEWLEKKKAEQHYQENLVRFAGNPGVDAFGRSVDKREFRETRKALDWLGTCHMGWFRHNPLSYKHDLLDRLGDDFTRQGLSVPSGIVMKVSDDGSKWYAWRRTVGGHCFAIGADDAPPNLWHYDGPEPPTNYPGDAPEWGQSPFSNDASPNWSE
ncbi:hypothetical protein [Desulfuromonas acetoxidans]|uniref:hypothetical protein n=1 Tax=Desulfuromonas acetoxidans TaxID=891 RepID=UPI0029308E7A|nr:hypothetical protein [Desulfuromonas acetoxidans]